MQKIPSFGDLVVAAMVSFVGFGLVIGVAQASVIEPNFRSYENLYHNAKLQRLVANENRRLQMSASSTVKMNDASSSKQIVPAPTAKLDPKCVISAIEKRDASIINGLESYTANSKTALSDRTTALSQAWSITDRTQRKAALKKIWNDYRVEAKRNMTSLNQVKKQSWDSFLADNKACGAYAVADDGTNRYVDASL